MESWLHFYFYKLPFLPFTYYLKATLSLLAYSCSIIFCKFPTAALQLNINFLFEKLTSYLNRKYLINAIHPIIKQLTEYSSRDPLLKLVIKLT